MELKVGDKVDLLVVRNLAIGFTVLVNEVFEGMLYKSELYQKIAEGQKLVGYVKKIREDEKSDSFESRQSYWEIIVRQTLSVLSW